MKPDKAIELIKELGIPKFCETYGIKATPHKIYSNLVLFKYDIGVSWVNDFLKPLRGIILDTNNWSIVSYPFNKFFNAEEFYADKIDWNSAQVYEKLDGSLITMYRYNNEWHFATSGTPDADCPVMNFPFTFRELVKKIWEEKGYFLPPNEDCCYMFELMTKYNKVVVQHSENRLALIGIRNLNTLKEVNIDEFKNHVNWELVNKYDISNLEGCFDAARKLDPARQEGFIVVDSDWNRVKIKSPAYVALHHIKERGSFASFVEILQKSESEEFLAYFPEFKNDFELTKQKYEALAIEIDAVWNNIKHIQVRKDFALIAVKTRLPSCLFALLDKRVKSSKEYLGQMDSKGLTKLLQLQ